MKARWLFHSYLIMSGGFVLSSLLIVWFRVYPLHEQSVYWGCGAILAAMLLTWASTEQAFLEPAIGGLLLIVTVILVFWLTVLGEFILKVAFDIKGKPEILKYLAGIAGTFFFGGLIGAGLGYTCRRSWGVMPQGGHVFLAYFKVLGGIFLGLFAIFFLAASMIQQASPPTILGGVGLGAFVGGAASRWAGTALVSVVLGAILSGVTFLIFVSRGGTAAMIGVIILAMSIIGASSLGAICAGSLLGHSALERDDIGGPVF